MAESRHSYRPVRLLIVDEDQETQRMARVFLRRQGYEVETVQTRKATLRALLSSFYDVVLVNLVAEKMQPTQLVTSIQSIWPVQKLILMAPEKDSETRATARGLGIEQILTTPLSLRKLNKAVQKICRLPARGGSDSVPFQERDLTGELGTLQQVTSEVLETLSPTQLFQTYAKALGTAIPSMAAGVLGMTDFYTCLFTHEVHPLPDEAQERLDQILAEQVKQLTGDPLPSPLQHEVQAVEPDTAVLPGEWSILTAPVAGDSGSKLEAVLLVVLPGSMAANQSEMDALYLASQHLSTLLQSFAAARRVSMWDPVTGLHNQRYLEDSLPRIWSIALRNRHPLAILNVDLDGFTGLNTQRGYIRGDEVMREAGNRMKSCIGETDLLIRKKGDRFQVLLTNPAEGELEKMGQAVREALSEPYAGKEESDQLGCTIAGARGGPDQGIQSYQQLMDLTDRKMVTLKQSGGNGIGFWTPEDEAGANEFETHPVLLVDDDPQVQKLIRKMLGQGLVELTAVSSVDEAEDLFRQDQRFEVMLTDIAMQERDGFEMLRVAANLDPDMVCLVTSGNISKRTEELLADAGSEGVLRKPFRAEDVRTLIGTAIESYTSRQRKKGS